MRKTLLAIGIFGTLAFPALAQTTDDNTSPGGTIRGPNEQVMPADGMTVDGTTTESTLPPAEESTPKDSTTKNVGGSGIEPDQNPQSNVFGTHSN